MDAIVGRLISVDCVDGYLILVSDTYAILLLGTWIPNCTLVLFYRANKQQTVSLAADRILY